MGGWIARPSILLILGVATITLLVRELSRLPPKLQQILHS